MANTYSQLFIHLVFAVKYRRAIIPIGRRNEIYAYMGGIINRYPKCQSIKIGGVSDHVHILLRISPTVKIAELVQSIKIGATNFINEKHLTPFLFAWQEGYGVFSISSTHTEDLEKYIDNQIEHHLGVTFQEEYREILSKNKIDYDDRFLFKELE